MDLLDPALRLQPGQQKLTPAQEAEARRFAEECIQQQLSTEPVDEQEAEAWLRQAYQVAGLALPARIQWFDGPLQLVAEVASEHRWRVDVEDQVRDRVQQHLLESIRASLWDSVRKRIEDRIEHRVWAGVGASIEASLDDCMGEDRKS